MYLKRSIKNHPYIEFDNGAKFIFSNITKEEMGYRYICFSHNIYSNVCLSKNKSKKKKVSKIFKKISFVTPIDLSKVPKSAKYTLTPITLNYLKKVFKSLSLNGYFPEKNINVLKNILLKLNSNEDDKCNNDLTANESFDEL